MTDPRNSWNEAGEKLTELGRKLKVHYDTKHSDTEGPTRDELSAAARKLGAAVQDAFAAIGTAARDTSVQEDVKQVGSSIVDALGVTFGQVSEDLKRAFSERKGDVGVRPAGAPTTPPATSPGADETVTEPPAPGPAATDSPDSPAAPATGDDDGGTPPKVEPWGTP